jgi:response regulator RpfG family c-di-GMP phosphodiesterase/serine/threonine protein kinase
MISFQDEQRRGGQATEPLANPSAALPNAGPLQGDSPSRMMNSLPHPARAFLDRLLQLNLLSTSSAEDFLSRNSAQLSAYTGEEVLGRALVQSGLLTGYQVDRVRAGTTHGLVLGNHRILERLGSGSMGVVFLAEHALMKRRVAIKVLPVDEDCPPQLLERFYNEMRILAELHHPNIVLAIDAGQLAPAGPQMPGLVYLAMELVPGGDLEQYVSANGSVDVVQACTWVYQAACGLQEAHDHHLIHRDVKPSNLLLSKDRQVKLVDFGLAHQFSSRITNPLAMLGTVGYMAPEQSMDPSLVDGRADIYGLGATLFWLLTGETPYPAARTAAQALRRLQSSRPRRLRALRPDISEELEALVDRLLDRDPAQRPEHPFAVMNALLPFAAPFVGKNQLAELLDESPATSGPDQAPARTSQGQLPRPCKRVLIVDDDASLRKLTRNVLEPLGCACDEAETGADALTAFAKSPYDLLLLDLNLPDMDGYEICRRLRERPAQEHFKIVIVSGRGDHDELAESLPRGADDYVPKPFGCLELRARVEHALLLKEAQDRAEFLAKQISLTNRQLKNSLEARTRDVREAQDALLFAMAKMAESRDGETAGHLRRLQRYCRRLAECVAQQPSWVGVINSAFLDQLERCVPLHDIGKIALPEHILLKPGKLDAGERRLMEAHALIGDQILEALGQEHGTSLDFLTMAGAIVRHHHERYDGTGYPDGLVGDAIPPAARLVALADVYDALRRERSHKPALCHAEARRIVLEGSSGHFDPALVQAFTLCEAEFERIYRDIAT